MTYKASIILLVVLLFVLGTCVGVYAHTLDLIKNLIPDVEIPTEYPALLPGIRFNLFFLWDIMSLMIMVSLVLCFMFILLGVILRRD